MYERDYPHGNEMYSLSWWEGNACRKAKGIEQIMKDPSHKDICDPSEIQLV